jgi:hypothetical protein
LNSELPEFARRCDDRDVEPALNARQLDSVAGAGAARRTRRFRMHHFVVVLFTLLSSLWVVHAADAGDVTVIAKSGKIALKGSAGADAVVIGFVDEDLIRVEPLDATTLNGSTDDLVLPLTAGVTIDLGEGDNQLYLEGLSVNGGLKIKMGGGSDVLALDFLDVTGAVKIDLGPGVASVSLCDVSIERSAALKVGEASPGFSQAGCEFVDNTNVFVADGVAVALGDVTVDGGLTVSSKRGAAKLIASQSEFGKTKLAFGNGAVSVGLCEDEFDESLSISTKSGTASDTLSCLVDGKTTSLTSSHGVLMVGTDVFGSFSVKGGKDPDAVTMDSSSDVGGSVKLSYSDGPSVTTIGGTIETNLTVTGGKGVHAFTANGLSVWENAKLSFGDGGNAINLGDAMIDGDLTIKTGNGSDIILTDFATVGGTKIIKPGQGPDNVH